MDVELILTIVIVVLVILIISIIGGFLLIIILIKVGFTFDKEIEKIEYDQFNKDKSPYN